LIFPEKCETSAEYNYYSILVVKVKDLKNLTGFIRHLIIRRKRSWALPKPTQGFAPGPHLGPCPWTPPPFEKGGRKLRFGLGCAQPTRGFAPGPLSPFIKGV